MKLLVAYFRAKADLCRELADALACQDDPVISKLHGMADEFDHNAGTLEQRLIEEILDEPVQASTLAIH
ncbi:hypothetical protein C0214_04925 [Methylobacterium sp. DM1]|nr:hypothetical protein C0214_04925 [Methylobacterium sp. DM1]